MHREITSPLFFLPLKLGGLGVGSAVQRHAAAPWRAWQSIISFIDVYNPISGHRFTFSFNTTTTCPTHSTPIHHLPTNEQTLLPAQPLGAALRLQTTQKKQVSTIQRNIHKQLCNSLTDTPTEQAILLSQSTSHTGAHLMQPRSEAYEIEDRCFRVSVARRLMLRGTVLSGVICNKPLDPKQHYCYGCRFGGGVDRRHAALARCLADIIHSHSGVKVFIEQEVPALTRVVIQP